MLFPDLLLWGKTEFLYLKGKPHEHLFGTSSDMLNSVCMLSTTIKNNKKKETKKKERKKQLSRPFSLDVSPRLYLSFCAPLKWLNCVHWENENLLLLWFDTNKHCYNCFIFIPGYVHICINIHCKSASLLKGTYFGDIQTKHCTANVNLGVQFFNEVKPLRCEGRGLSLSTVKPIKKQNWKTSVLYDYL